MTTFEHTEDNIVFRCRSGSWGGRFFRTSILQDKLVSFVLSSAVGCLTVVLLLAAAPPLQACDDGWTVPNPENNPGLVEDCRVLLAIRDDLAGTGFLNWEFGLPLDRWGGIRVSGSPSRVRQLVLFGDDRSGSIPSGLGRLSQLQTLRLLSRQLMGPIPPELGQLSHLEELSLSGDRLGTIPAELGQLSRLRRLGLVGNQLTGPIPAELGQLSNLRRLHLQNNELTGPIPAELGQLSQLEAMSLDHNKLTGPIPVELGQLSQLGEGLHLQNNQLTGQIPGELGRLSQLWGELDLRNNQLAGPIPAELGQLSQLTRLYLQDNQLTGSIPPELGQMSRLLELYLHNNKLTGPIPAELGKLSRLWRLHLQNNELTGSVPAELGQLSELQEFGFRGNRLTGSVPTELSHLPDVYVLNLHARRITPEQIKVTWDDPGDPSADYEYRLVLRDENLNYTVTDWTEIEDPEATLGGGEGVTIEWTLTNLPAELDVVSVRLRAKNENGPSPPASAPIEPLQVSEDVDLPYCRSLWPGRARCTTTTVLPHVFMGPLGEDEARAEILITNRSGFVACDLALLFHQGTSEAPQVLFDNEPLEGNLFEATFSRRTARILTLTSDSEELVVGAVSVFVRAPCSITSFQIRGRYLVEDRMNGDIQELFSVSGQSPREWLGNGDCQVLTGVFGPGRNLGFASVTTEPNQGAPAGTQLHLQAFDLEGNPMDNPPSMEITGAQTASFPWSFQEPTILKMCLEVPEPDSQFQLSTIAIGVVQKGDNVQWSDEPAVEVVPAGQPSGWPDTRP